VPFEIAAIRIEAQWKRVLLHRRAEAHHIPVPAHESKSLSDRLAGDIENESEVDGTVTPVKEDDAKCQSRGVASSGAQSGAERRHTTSAEACTIAVAQGPEPRL
jgi:hypothetical protein